MTGTTRESWHDASAPRLDAVPAMDEAGRDELPWHVRGRNEAEGKREESGSAAGLEALALALGPEGAAEAPSRGPDLKQLLIGVYRRRWLVIAITLLIAMAVTAAVTVLVKPQWRSAVALVKRSQVDQFSVEDAETFKPETYNLRTLLDTLKLPSSLDRVLRNTGT